jgi:hypothetical protein
MESVTDPLVSGADSDRDGDRSQRGGFVPFSGQGQTLSKDAPGRVSEAERRERAAAAAMARMRSEEPKR